MQTRSSVVWANGLECWPSVTRFAIFSPQAPPASAIAPCPLGHTRTHTLTPQKAKNRERWLSITASHARTSEAAIAIAAAAAAACSIKLLDKYYCSCSCCCNASCSGVWCLAAWPNLTTASDYTHTHTLPSNLNSRSLPWPMFSIFCKSQKMLTDVLKYSHIESFIGAPIEIWVWCENIFRLTGAAVRLSVSQIGLEQQVFSWQIEKPYCWKVGYYCRDAYCNKCRLS